MIARGMRRLALILVIALVACDQVPSGTAKAQRLAKAESAMNECKKRVGLEEVATPTGMVLDDPATRGQEMTPEMAGQLRLKVQCALELNELLAARREAK